MFFVIKFYKNDYLFKKLVKKVAQACFIQVDPTNFNSLPDLPILTPLVLIQGLIILVMST